jgi:sugar phosphate isomerase/epimerase
MNTREIAVVVNNDNQNVSIIETINAIKNAGFKNVFIQWYNKDWIPTQEEQLKYIRKKGLNIIFAHLGYQNINDLWLENEDGDKLVNRYINDIRICKEHSIPMVVMHLTSKHKAPKYNETGLKRLQKIVDYAQSLNVKVAFENTKIMGYLDYVIEHIDNENVGICFDSGHYHVHFNDKFDFDKFKNRIFAIHLHDNDKSDDLHLIPFDGTLNWDDVINKLKECHYTGPITMELCYRDRYLNMGIKEFYKKGYEVGLKLKEMFEME